jgi:hypothetical protein
MHRYPSVPLAAAFVLAAVTWSPRAVAQAYGDHIRDRDSDSTSTATTTGVPAPDPEPRPPAREPPAYPFGSRGQWVVTGASNMVIRSTTYSGSQANRFYASFSPGLDWFVLRNFSVGVTLDFETSDSKGYLADGTLSETKGTTSSGGARLGYNLPIDPGISLYPRITGGYASVRTTATVPAATVTVEHDGPWAALDAPIVFEPRPHFFVAVVPGVSVSPSSGIGGPSEGGSNVSAGAGFLVGGTFGKRDPAPEPAAELDEPTAPPKRFGSAGTVALDSALSAYGHETTYPGTQNNYTSFGVVLGLDYFFADHLSFGGGLSVAHYDARGNYVGSGAPYTSSDTTYGFEVRFGLDLPLHRYVSLYPGVSLGLGAESFDSESGGAANKGSATGIYTNVFAPVLVHVARHVFVGLGPQVYADLGRTYSPSNQTNNATSFGAAFTVGGWL